MSYNFNFVKHRKKYFLISGVIQILGLIALLVFGFNLGVDFQSGTRLDISIGKSFVQEEVLTEIRNLKLNPGSIQTIGDNNEIASLRFPETLTKEQVAQIKEVFTTKYGNQVDLQESTVDPMISKELAKQAFYGVLLASVGIVIYVAIRFEYRFAVSAIVALLHDAFGVIAVFSIFQFEIDLPFIAAILTIVGYSINDTIVIFDRIRENLRLHKVKRFEDLEEIVNRSIRETLTRSINTVLTVVFAAAALFVLGGESIRTFSLALLIGLVFGAYSSIFIASQMWLSWKAKEFKNGRPIQAQNQG